METEQNKVSCVFVYYTNSKNAGRDEEIYKRFKGNFPATFRIILVPTQEPSERLECIYPKFVVADDFAKDIKDIEDQVRKALQLETTDDITRNEILKTIGYGNDDENSPKDVA